MQAEWVAHCQQMGWIQRGAARQYRHQLQGQTQSLDAVETNILTIKAKTLTDVHLPSRIQEYKNTRIQEFIDKIGRSNYMSRVWKAKNMKLHKTYVVFAIQH